MIAELDAHLEPLYPRESRHGFSVQKLITECVDFFVIRDAGVPAGCGGIKLFGTEYGEIKRLYVRPQFRGLGFGKLLLEHLAHHAKVHGVEILRLETGIHQHPAIRLYEQTGFKRITPPRDRRAARPTATLPITRNRRSVGDDPRPTTTCRKMAFADAAFDGAATPEGVEAHRVTSPSGIPAVAAQGIVAVYVGPFAVLVDAVKPDVLVDARMRSARCPRSSVVLRESWSALVRSVMAHHCPWPESPASLAATRGTAMSTRRTPGCFGPR